MSLTRQFFREIRPLFRMLEEPLGRPTPFGGLHRSLLEDPFFRNSAMLQPAVDVTEEGNKYVIEAELPGVKKENVQISVGDGGRSVTIEGKVVSRRSEPEGAEASVSNASSAPTEGAVDQAGEGSKVVSASPEQTQLSNERLFSSSSSFSRTVYLPRPVDTSNVVAKLSDGVLTVTIPKAEDPATVQIPIQ